MRTKNIPVASVAIRSPHFRYNYDMVTEAGICKLHPGVKVIISNSFFSENPILTDVITVTADLHDLAAGEKSRIQDGIVTDSGIQATEHNGSNHVLEGGSKVKCDTDEKTTDVSKPIPEGQPSRLLDASSDSSRGDRG